MSQALLIVGHGSHLNADSSAPVYDHAAAIRELGIFDEVRECFWKEEPELRYAWDVVEAERVFVVPLFISEGYFTEEVVPRELGLRGAAPSETVIRGMRVSYTGPIGTHPSMGRMILRRAEEAAGLTDAEAAEAGLIVIGHGTERNARSSEAVYEVTHAAREAGIFGTVEAGFLDQPPSTAEVLERMSHRRVVLVPFFVAEGWHTQETIPDDLGINRPSVSAYSRLGDREVYYSAPVGTFPEIANIVLQRAWEAGATVPRARLATSVRDG